MEPNKDLPRRVKLCTKCAARLATRFYAKKARPGKDDIVDCVVCGRHYYGGDYILIERLRPRG